MNLAFNIRCSFSKFQAKQLRNKDVGQQNAHCGASFDISVGECGHSRPDRHLEVLIIILNFPPQWTCAHAHTHTHKHIHTISVTTQASWSAVCVLHINVQFRLCIWHLYGMGAVNAVEIPSETVALHHPIRLGNHYDCVSSWFVTLEQTRVSKNKVFWIKWPSWASKGWVPCQWLGGTPSSDTAGDACPWIP